MEFMIVVYSILILAALYFAFWVFLLVCDAIELHFYKRKVLAIGEQIAIYFSHNKKNAFWQDNFMNVYRMWIARHDLLYYKHHEVSSCVDAYNSGIITNVSRGFDAFHLATYISFDILSEEDYQELVRKGYSILK